MRRYVIGGLVGFAAWLGTGLIAHAQSGIDGIGPTTAHVSDSSSNYQATVTTSNNFLLTLRVKLNGVQKHFSRTYVVTSGPSYNFSKTVYGMNNWGMAIDDQLDYHGKAQGAGGSPEDHHYVTVEKDPITLENRSRNRAPEEGKFADRFRGILA